MTPLLYGRGKNDLNFSNNAKKKFNTVFGLYLVFRTAYNYF